MASDGKALHVLHPAFRPRHPQTMELFFRNAKYMKAVINNILSHSDSTGKPFLFLHGDYHFFESEYSWHGKNILRVMVGQKMDKPIVITVTNDINTPFIVNEKDDHFKKITASPVPE